MTIKEIFAGESDNLEFKEEIPTKSEKFMKTVVAFANGSGGRLIFGIENNSWRVIGFTKEEVFRKVDAITNAIYDSCDPKITPSVGIHLCIPELHAVEDLPLDVKPGIVSSVRRVNLVDVCRLPINRGERLRLLGHRRFLHRFEYLRP